jgi:hypothetical protein
MLLTSVHPFCDKGHRWYELYSPVQNALLRLNRLNSQSTPSCRAKDQTLSLKLEGPVLLTLLIYPLVERVVSNEGDG